MYNDREYRQDHRPVVEQDRAVGHAVRATYMYAGMADVALRVDRPAYRTTLEALFRDVIGKRLYVTGGIGARSAPNRSATITSCRVEPHTETCAAIGLEQWAVRMFRLTGDGQYLDLAELVLYNGALSGVSSSGDRFFYQNPLASDGKVARSAYFDVACCPANLARTLAALPGLMYASDGSTMYMTLYGSSEARLTIGGTPILLTQRTRYPWDGDIELRVEPDKTTTATLALHVPGWAQGRLVNSDLYRLLDTNLPTPTAVVNGQAVRITLNRGFARIARDRAATSFTSTSPCRSSASSRIPRWPIRIAQRPATRPLVYALESVDNGPDLERLRIPVDADIRTVIRNDLLGGIQVLAGDGTDVGGSGKPRPFVAIPYFAWANRGPSEMRVWVRQ